ncbi:sensor histidine kinase [Herbidospora cretacea]|uniref:sensor histidine kinase n=1 Tax=Herbidospora cretacea TaxID=28444 RepID=UPI0007747C48|nr:ATP-binding protein [Herbidospora cretacea]
MAQVVDPLVAPAAICRTVLLGRAAVVLTSAGAGLLLVPGTWRVLSVVALTVVATVAEVTVLTRRPAIVRRALPVIAADWVVASGVLLLSRGGMAYFCFAAGSAALAGALMGMRALPIWAVQAAFGFGAAAWALRAAPYSPDVAAFVMAFPMLSVLAGMGGAVAAAALVRYVDLSVEAASSAQRSAAADERARLARELHDSVSKTLRGVSFAALALPSSLRRHPALAEQLADTVSKGAEVAAREARQLLEGLRGDSPDRSFGDVVHEICRSWQQDIGLTIRVTVACAEPGVAVRYEMIRLLQEALTNIRRHAHASHVTIRLTQSGGVLELIVGDDGVGFTMPEELSRLQSQGHFGLVGMAERARAVGGHLRVRSFPGAGTVVTAVVPVAQLTEVGE